MLSEQQHGLVPLHNGNSEDVDVQRSSMKAGQVVPSSLTVVLTNIRHCVDAEGNTVSSGCAAPDYEYNVPLRIGLLFVILAASGIGVLGPVLTLRFTKFDADHVVLVCLRQCEYLRQMMVLRDCDG